MSKLYFKSRNDVPDEFRWDLSSLYTSDEAWQDDCENIKRLTADIKTMEKTMTSDASSFLASLKMHDEISLTLERIFVYAHMKKDEDNQNSKYLSFMDKAQTLIAEISAELSFFTPAVSMVDPDTFDKFIENCPELEIYRHFYNVIQRHKPHILAPDYEEIIAKFSQLTSCAEDVFSIINNADMDFGSVKNSLNEEISLTHGSYISMLESDDRVLRKNAFQKLYSTYAGLKNTFAQTYNYSVKTDIVTAGLRNYSSSLEASLFADNVPTGVYDNLIDTVNKNLSLLHRYMSLKKKMLGLQELHMYDIYVPFENSNNRYIPFEEAVEIMQKALSPLGQEYVKTFMSGIKDRWIDVYENQGKSSGAYSFGAYDSNPYILLNYGGRLKDVFTLVHEMGHSMHSWYTRKTQPFVYGGHSIFTAEVASTVNENLLMHYLINNAVDESEIKYLLATHLEEFRGTVFRQTMFAEFETSAHRAALDGNMLSCDFLSKMYSDLNKKYMGNAVFSDDEISLEWARIPHFYSSFYVYKYATGFLAASYIARNILSGPDGYTDKYINFLKSGNSDYPIELLKIADVDMCSPDPIDEGMKEFAEILYKLESLAG